MLKGEVFMQIMRHKGCQWHMKVIKIILLVAAATAILSGCRQEVELENISSITAQPDARGIHVSWAASKDADCYYVYRKAENDATYSYWGVTEKTELTDITVMDGEQYTYRVFPALKTDNEYHRGGQYLTTDSIFVLGAPSIASVQRSAAECTIQWGAVKNAANYSIYRKEAEAQNFERIGETKMNYYVDSAFDASKGYSYAVEANSFIDETAYPSKMSDAVSAYRAPMISSALREDYSTSVIMWENIAEGVEYAVYRAQIEEGEYELIGTTEQTFYRDMTAPSLIASETSTAIAPANYYYKVQVHAKSMDALSYSEKSLSAQLDSGAVLSAFFAARYVDFVSRDGFADALTEAVYADEFEKDLIDLKNQGYVTVTSKEVIDYINNAVPLPEKAVMLTIDGARRGAYEYAYPLLQKYGMRAVLSVMGGDIDSAAEVSQGSAAYCSWNELAEMEASGCFELAAQGYNINNVSDSNANNRDGVLKLEYESMEEYIKALSGDITLINNKLSGLSGQIPVIFTYPSASRDSVSDSVLTQEFSYALLLGDDDARNTRMNYFIDDAPPQTQRVLINRRDRLSGTTLMEYIVAAQRFDAENAGQ